MPTYRVNLEAFIGRDLGSVTLLSVLGEGSVATVFQGFQRRLRRKVAVKILLKSHETGVASSKLFHTEAELVGSLHHPNIVPIYDMGEEDDCFFQVMHLVEGENLQAMLARKARNPVPGLRLPPVSTTLNLLIQILDALGYAHEEGVVHRDIKPSNILLEARGSRPLIADFGIATAEWTGPQQEGKLEGTPLFMAPEYVAGGPPTPSVDIYACGIMLFQMLAGELPLAEKDVHKLLLRKIDDPDSIFTARPSQINPGIDAALERIILDAIEPRADKRYATCAGFRSQLDHYLLSHSRTFITQGTP